MTPVGEVTIPRLSVSLRIDQMAGTSAIIAQTHNNALQIVDAIVILRSREEQVSGSVCQISSLEVYRGREQAIEISHQGFSLNDNGSIEV